MRWSTLAGPILLALGAVAVAAAVALGGAHAALFLIFPVIYGSSLLFLLGVVLLVAGMLTVPLSISSGISVDSAPPSSGEVSSGGLVLIGPIPIFWGSASSASRRARVAAAVAGGVALVVATAIFLTLYR